MAFSPWTIELMRRGLAGVSRHAGDPERIDRLKTRATQVWHDLPDSAAQRIDRVMRTAEAGKAFVQRWSRQQTALTVPLLNASGILMNQAGTGVPLAAEILAVGQEAWAGHAEVSQRLDRRLQRSLPTERDHQIAITSSFPAALATLALVSAADRGLVVHRHHAVRLPGGIPLPEALRAHGATIREVGAIDRIHVSDFDDSQPFCSVLADDGRREIEPLQWPADPDNRGRQAVILPVGTVHSLDGTMAVQEAIPSAEQLLAEGADYVLLPGSGLGGGPECGILIGPRESIERITGSAAWSALTATAAVRAMMCAALEAAGSPEQRLPIEQLMATGEENLQGRAERLATRLSGCESITHSQVTGDPARLTVDGRWKFPSRQVAVKHASLTAELWQRKLRRDWPSVAAAVDGDALKLDLRWIGAADDGKLGELLEAV